MEIRRVSSKSLVGQSPENIRHFIELRGIGIINARRIFGMGAVKLSEKIDMCINLEIWDATKVYDRMGIDSEYAEILGIRVPVMTIPVKPGRNLAIIIEVAAMNNRQKKMGYNAAHELLSALGMDASMMPHEEIKREARHLIFKRDSFMYNIIADLHTHTLASTHAYSTVQEMAVSAREKGLFALALTDHARTMPGAPGPWFLPPCVSCRCSTRACCCSPAWRRTCSIFRARSTSSTRSAAAWTGGRVDTQHRAEGP